MKSYKIWSDGSCLGNPGPGGTGFIILDLETQVYTEFSSSEYATTNNRMELSAAILALSTINEPSNIELITDSNYVGKGITEWITNWKANNWRTKSGPVKNKDLWELFDELVSTHNLTFTWVKGHNNDVINEKVDGLAKAAALDAKTKNNQ